MDVSMNALALVYQEPALPDSNEELIQMLGLGRYAGNNAGNPGKLVDDMVRDLDLNCFESIQGHQQFMGHSLGAYQPTETIAYVDLCPPEIETSPVHVSGGSLFINDANSSPASPQEVSSFVPSAPASPQKINSFIPTTSVDNQDARKPAGGKTTRRRREQKPKLYEREEPMSDPEEEKKRQNAINAKLNRDKNKHRMQELDNLVKSLTTERDALQSSNTKLRNKCDAFEKQLKTVCQQFNVPVIILPQD